METKIYNFGKPIKIRKLLKNDLNLRNVKKFRDFVNSLINEEAMISMNKKIDIKEERDFLKGVLKNIKNRKRVFLVVESSNRIVGTTTVELERWRQSHVGKFGITIKQGYRGIGLGKYLVREIIKLARKELKPKPKIIRLSVYPGNKPAINLYKNFGFRKVAVVPRQYSYKGKLIDEIIMLKEL